MAAVNLTWTPATGANITEQRIYRGTASNSLSLLVSGLSSTASSYSDTTVLDNTTYYYRVDSICNIGGPTPSNVTSLTTSVSCSPASEESATNVFTTDFVYPVEDPGEGPGEGPVGLE